MADWGFYRAGARAPQARARADGLGNSASVPRMRGKDPGLRARVWRPRGSAVSLPWHLARTGCARARCGGHRGLAPQALASAKAGVVEAAQRRGRSRAPGKGKGGR